MKGIDSILIANRGEIASRIIRTCRKMGIRSIAVFSEADRNAPFVSEADTAIYIGESTPTHSYLNPDKIIEAAKEMQAEAIHPGYGFLSENAGFARRCLEEGIIFIGPHPEAIAAMGSKSQAKALMEANGVPVVPGYRGKDQGTERLQQEAKNIGYPLLLKATAGGGGKGMRIVREEKSLADAIEAAKREASAAFGDDELLIEKYVESGRHIEFQIFGDQQGNAIHLLERECTIQRRYQKVIEESPSPVLTPALRARMGQAAVQAAKALNYDNAGTVEFIFDEKSQEFYFLEVNTRLQVEHPVTEEICGLDLVQMQIESAMGMPLPLSQEDVASRGYAVEVRLYAEDPNNDFLPVTGTVHEFITPKVEGLRVESAIQSGTAISIYYDPMIAKLIVWEASRQAAHRKMRYVLQQLVCSGTVTNQNFLLQILSHPEFQAGNYDTHFIDTYQQELLPGNGEENDFSHPAIAVCLYRWEERNKKRTLLKALPSGWRNSYYEPQHEVYEIRGKQKKITYRKHEHFFEFLIGEISLTAILIDKNENHIRLEIEGKRYLFHISHHQQTYFVHSPTLGSTQLTVSDRFPEKEKEQVRGGYVAPMPSQVVKLLVKEGDEVKEGEGLIVLSSMKMENTVYANESGQVKEVYVVENSHVEAEVLLMKIDPIAS